MADFDLQYNRLGTEILATGHDTTGEAVRAHYADGTPAYTKQLIAKQFRFDNSEFPCLTNKNTLMDKSKEELFWIWVEKSNDVRWLQERGNHIWDEWMMKDFSIGPSYGWQLAKKCRVVDLGKLNGSELSQYAVMDQVDWLLHSLQHDRSSRRIMTSLFDVERLHRMALQPCVYETHWIVEGSKLSLIVKARSSDYALGLPFNVSQYNILQRMVAQVTGYELGEYIFDMDIPHIYDRHEEKLKKQFARPTHEAPKIWLNPEVKNFYDFKLDDIQILDYKHESGLLFEVAI